MNTFTLGLIVLVYLLSLAYLGWLGYRKTNSAADYLIGGGEMNPVVMAKSSSIKPKTRFAPTIPR